MMGPQANGYLKNLALAPVPGGVSDVLEFPVRPYRTTEKHEPVYADIGVLGMSHEESGYSHSRSPEYSFALHFDAMLMARLYKISPSAAADRIEQSKNFLRALTVAPQMPSGFAGGDTPTAFLYIPRQVSMKCKLRGPLMFEEDDSLGSGGSLHMSVNLTFRAVYDARRTMQDYLARGMMLGES